ncbi:MAG: metallophosphoesterase family protein [Candidatus Lokiarchaeia archaeon]
MENFTKFAIISDIHANKYALSTFLKYLDDYFDANKILNLGDNVSIGPHPKEVVQTVLSDERFVNIAGNNELIVLGQRKNEWHRGTGVHRQWVANQLGKELLDEINKLPTSQVLKIQNRKVLMLHSHFYDIPGRTIQDNILLYQGKSMEEFINDYPKDVDIVLVGHSHEQLYLGTKEKIIINPGSISITWKPEISFCLLEIDDTKMNVNFKNIAYDASGLLNDYEQRKVAGREFLVKYFYPFL